MEEYYYITVTTSFMLLALGMYLITACVATVYIHKTRDRVVSILPALILGLSWPTLTISMLSLELASKFVPPKPDPVIVHVV